MLNITGNIVSVTIHPDRATGRIAVGGRQPLFLPFTAFGPFAQRVMSMVEKGQYITLSGHLTTLPKRQVSAGRAEQNTVLKAESLVIHGPKGPAAGGSGRGRTDVALFGRVGHAPDITGEIAHAAGAFSAANISVAENVSHVQQSTGEVVERTEWHSVVVYGEPNSNPAANLAQGDAVFIRGYVESDSYEALDKTRINAVRTVATELVSGQKNHLSASVCGTVKSARRRSDHIEATLNIAPIGAESFDIELLAQGAESADMTEGRYLAVSGTLTHKRGPRSPLRLRADARSITMLDTDARPGGTGAGRSSVYAVGTLNEKPDATVLDRDGEKIAVASALLDAGGDGRPQEIELTVWRNAAEILHEYSGPGDRLLMTGSLGASRDGTARPRINFVRML